MSTYTPELIRAYVDDLDALFREAVASQRLQETFEREKKRIDGLMRVARETRDLPDVQEELNAPRFLWELTRNWRTAKIQKELSRFWDRQDKTLDKFDEENPGRRPSAKFPLPDAERPQLPAPKQLQVMTTVHQRAAVASMDPAPATSTQPRQTATTSPPPKTLPAEKPTKPAAVTPRPHSPPPKVSPAPALPVVKPTKPAAVRPRPIQPKKSQPDASTSRHRSPPTQSLPSKRNLAYGKMRRPADDGTDADAEGESDDDEPITQPASARKRVPAPLPVANTKSPAPVPVETISNEEWEESDEDARKERRRRKGKGREEDVNMEEKQVKHEGKGEGGSRWKRPEVKSTGIERDPACKRCVRGGRMCYKQTGGLIACVDCTKVKMKCVPADEEDRKRKETKPAAGTSKPKRPAPKNATGSKRPASPALEGPSKKRAKLPAPAASGTKKKTVKSKEMVDTSEDDEPAPAAPSRKKGKAQQTVASDDEDEYPAPAAPSRKKGKARQTVASDDEDEELAPAPDMVTSWPGGRRNFEEFESFYDVRVKKCEFYNGRLGEAIVECTKNATRLEGRIGNIEGSVKYLEEHLSETEEFRDSWVNSQSELTILSIRLDRQERTIEQLKGQLQHALEIIRELGATVSPAAGPSTSGEIIDLVDDSPRQSPAPMEEDTVVPDTAVVPEVEQVRPPLPAELEAAERDVPASEEVIPATETLAEADEGGEAPAETSEEPAVAAEAGTAPSTTIARASVDAGDLPRVSAPVEADAGDLPARDKVSAPVERPLSSTQLASDMPPPSIPSSSQVPAVKVLPPTPNTSQEAENHAKTELLAVPVPAPAPSPAGPSATRRTRSRSPAPPDPSQVRRSPRLASPAPSAKRPAAEDFDQPAAKKLRE